MATRFQKSKVAPFVASFFTDEGTLRFMAMIALPTLFGFIVFLADTVVDSMLVRALIGLAFILSAGLTFVSKWARENARHFTHVLLTTLSLWAGALVLLNMFDGLYVASSLTLMLFCGFNLKNSRTFAVFATLNLSLSLVGPFLYPDYLQHGLAYAGLGIMVLGVAYIGLSFKFMIERELRRTSDLLKSILRNSPDGILVLSQRTLRVLQANPHAERLLGITDNIEALNEHWKPFLDEIHREWKPGETFLRCERRIKRTDGKEFWAEILLSHIDSGSRKLFLCTFTDITARVDAEQSLRLSDHILREVDHLVIVCDSAAEILYVSPALTQMVGFPAEELLGNGWWNLPIRPEAEHRNERELLVSTLSGKSPLRSAYYELSYTTKAGKRVWVQWKDSITHDSLMISMGMEYTEERKNILIRSVIFNIAEASSKVKSPGEFYQFIHKEICRAIDTPNFYIAVYDQVKDIVHFPYYADAADTKLPFSRKAGKGLTELTIRRKHPLLASKADILDLDEQGLVNVKGQSIPEVWLGVPLIHEDIVVGLITIQDYSQANTYTSDDLALLNFIAGQVAQFVSKLQSDEALRISEERFRAIYDHSAVGIAQITIESRFLAVNNRICEIFGYAESELLGLGPMDITFEDDKEVGLTELEEIRNSIRDSYTVEKRYVHRAGHIVHARVNVSAYREAGKIKFIISVYEDITERIRAQEETAMLFSLSNTLNSAPNVESAVTETLEHLMRQDLWEYGEAWVTDTENVLGLQAVEKKGIAAAVPDLEQGPCIGSHEDIYWLDDAGLNEKEYSRAGDFLQAGFQTVAILPLSLEGNLESCIIIASRRGLQATEQNLQVLSAARAQLRTFTLRKYAELAQKESEERYRAITEAAFEGIAIHRKGTILQANNAFANLFGIDAQQLVGISMLDLTHDEESRVKLAELLSGEGSVNIYGRRSDGERVDLEAVGRPGTWEGAPAGIVALRDITNENLMEAARETARIDARFRAYVQNSTEIILILEQDTTILYSSPTLERYTGLEPEAVVGTEFYRLLHPADVNSIRASILHVQEKPGASEKAALRMATEDGEWRNFQIAFTNLLHDPMVKGILVSAHDITELKRTEAAVLENETKFRAIFSQANDAIMVLEARSIVECNEMAEEMFAIPRGQLIGTTFSELSPETQPDGSDSRLKLHGKMGDALDGSYQYFTWKHRRFNGERFDAEISMSQIRIGEKLFLQCVIRDITERVLSENALRESERRNKAILDAIPDLILRVSDEGEVLDYKAADQQALIVAADNIIGGNIREFLPTIIVDSVNEAIQLALTPGEARQFETEFLLGNETRDFETRVVRSSHHEMLVIIRDVTERKRTEKELIKRNFELDSFVYRASHDLKAPLNSLMGLISIMGSENEDPLVQNYLKMMNKSVVKLDTFIRDLADFSRNDRAELELSPIDWKQTIQEALENLRFMETADRVEKIVEIRGEAPFQSDPVRVGIVLNNLVSNAIKYQNLRRNDAFVRIGVDLSAGQCKVVVSDNGIGISEEHLGKIFNLFFRASVQSYGSGLGMYIVKNAVERLNGTIQLESKLGEGSTVTVILPSIQG